MRRQWILSPSAGKDASNKYTMTRPELLQTHLEHFLTIHDPFTTTYIPTRDEIGYMTENTMHSGTLMNHWGLFVSTILLQARILFGTKSKLKKIWNNGFVSEPV